MTKYIVLLLIAAGCSNNHLKAANPERLENRISAHQERLRKCFADHKKRLEARMVADNMDTMKCQIDAFKTRRTEIPRASIEGAINSSNATLSFIASGKPRPYEKREPKEIVQRLTALTALLELSLLELSNSDD